MAPLTAGKSTCPRIITLVPGATSANPVITHLLPFCTMQPIYPELPDLVSKPDPSSAALRQCGCTFVTDTGNPIYIEPYSGMKLVTVKLIAN